jgi:magnesium chelatase subunit I
MNDQQIENDNLQQVENGKPAIRSLRELIELVSGRSFASEVSQEDSGLAENIPFPFLGFVGQTEMKLALLLALINPAIGGVLLIGPRGTGKTTAVRSLTTLLPLVSRSACFYGCLPEDIETGGIDAVCPDCAKKYAQGLPLTKEDPVRLIELPLNSKLEDVIGGLDERALVHERLRLKRGILAQADQNILYVDEINLLADEILDSILDAAAQGSYTIRRGPISATYRARFILVGSMNPEEGNLRPQIMDRFGLRVLVHGLTDPQQRLEVYRRVMAFRNNPRGVLSNFDFSTNTAQSEIQSARKALPTVVLPEEIAKIGIELIRRLKLETLRADITLFEAARAYTAADSRTKVDLTDILAVAPMALRLRRSQFMMDYFSNQEKEEVELVESIEALGLIR